MSERQERDEAIPLAKKALLADLDAAREAFREALAQADKAWEEALAQADKMHGIAVAQAWEAHHKREADLEAITRAEEVSRE